MEIPAQSDKFTPLQLEMLRLFSYDIPEGQLIDIRRLIVRYFADKLSESMDAHLEKQGIDVDKWVEDLKHEHLRTPYKPHKGIPFKSGEK